VRHGVASRIEGGKVRVSVACSAGRLRILIENPLDPDAPSRPGTGVGLANVRQRLAAKWGPDGLFAAKRLADRFLVVISVPAEASA
jgi:LytS/YehU family sensor histidine kinase